MVLAHGDLQIWGWFVQSLLGILAQSRMGFVLGKVQASGVAENWFTKPGFWEHFVSFSQEKEQNTAFTKFSSVRTPEI